MRVGVIQSNYIPWRGYFDFINSVDLFVFHDDIQYTKGDWRNRNKIKMKAWPSGSVWVTVPVHYRNVDQLIQDTEIDYSTDWQKDHLNRFKAGYSNTPHYEDAVAIFEQAYLRHDRTINRLNTRLIRLVCAYYGIKTLMIESKTYNLTGAKTDRLIDLLKKTGADCYLTGPNAKNYLDEKKFKDNGIKLEYKTYDYPPYKQPWGEFDGAVSIMDTIANFGNDMKMLKSLTPDKEV